MKLLITILLSACILNCGAQRIVPLKSSYIEFSKLEVTFYKTTNLIFPAAITNVDRGSQDILVQKAAGVENILRIKAGAEDFKETSLSVITADGKLYSFIVGYAEEPAYLNVDVGRVAGNDSTGIIYSEPASNKSLLGSLTDSVFAKGENMRAIRKGNSMVSVALNAIYIHEDIMLCKFQLENKSAINFDIDQLHFYLRDKKQAKRTSSQETELTPLLITGDTVKVRAVSFQPWVVALPKFTIPDGKVLSVEIMEKNGGRNLFLKVKNRHIMKAQRL